MLRFRSLPRHVLASGRQMRHAVVDFVWRCDMDFSPSPQARQWHERLQACRRSCHWRAWGDGEKSMSHLQTKSTTACLIWRPDASTWRGKDLKRSMVNIHNE